MNPEAASGVRSVCSRTQEARHLSPVEGERRCCLWAGTSARRLWRRRWAQAELRRLEDRDSQSRNAGKATGVEGGERVAICQRGGGDYEVVRTDRLAGAPQVGCRARMNACGW